MKSGTMFKQRDILIVPFPFSDLSGQKNRPVLVLSKDKDNNSADYIITCGITSNLKNAKYSVIIENKDLENGNIPSKSRIKVDKLFTIEKSSVIKKVAMINQKTFNKVGKEFNSLI